jgi:hypothetical protein
VKHAQWSSIGMAVAALLAWGCRTTEPAPTPAVQTERTGATEACGAQGQAECPTQRWMKATLQAYLRTRDYKRLEASFNELAGHGPGGFDRWETMAKAGANAAASQDEALVRKSCQDCHDSYRADFRRQYRSVVFM